MTNTEITHDQIQKGDTIRVEFAHQDITTTVVGVAHHLDFYRDWVTAKGQDLTYQRRTVAEKYFLLERPTRELPKDKGSVIRATEVRGLKGAWNMLKDHDGDWTAGTPINGYTYHGERDIADWQLLDLTPVTD